MAESRHRPARRPSHANTSQVRHDIRINSVTIYLMKNLNRFEAAEFLETFLQGLLEVGLFEPLQKLESSGTSHVKNAARSLHQFLVAGMTPQVAVCLMEPRFPSKIESLIVCGFEQSNIDYVLKDILQASKSATSEGQLDFSLDELLSRYSHLKTETICIECWTHEIEKIFRRARAEQASQVILSLQNGHFLQKYISTKLVTVTEPAIPAVYLTVQRAFIDHAQQPQKNLLNLKIKMLSSQQFQAALGDQVLTVSFAE